MGLAVHGAAKGVVRLGLPVEPHVLGVEQDLREAERHTRLVGGILGARFEDKHLLVWILGRSCRDDRSNGAAADDQEIVVLRIGGHGGHLSWSEGQDSTGFCGCGRGQVSSGTGLTNPFGLTAKTEHGSSLSTRSAVLPMNIPATPFRTTLPITVRVDASGDDKLGNHNLRLPSL